MSGQQSDTAMRIGQDDHKAALRQQRANEMGEADSFVTSSDDMSNQSHSMDSSSDEDSVGFSSDESDEADKGPDIIRIYDARFKIPAQSNLG